MFESKIPRLYTIADCDALGPDRVPRAVAEMAMNGVGWIQLRAKGLAGGDFFRLAEACLAATRGSAAELWIDDRVDLAALLPFAGVHLGERDLPPASARRLLAPGRWVGRSTHDLEGIRGADADRAIDVVALGPIFPTRNKARPDPVVGLDTLRRARPLTAKPLVAIGGIDAGNAADVLAAGADAVAVLGAVSTADVGASCRHMLAAVERGVSG